MKIVFFKPHVKLTEDITESGLAFTISIEKNLSIPFSWHLKQQSGPVLTVPPSGYVIAEFKIKSFGVYFTHHRS